MKFVFGFILIMLVILAEVQKEKMTMLMGNNLVKFAMLLSIVFIFKTKNVVLGVISGLVFLLLLVMTSTPLQEGFNNHGESNSLDDEEHMHVVQKLRGKNKGKSCSNLKLVPYKKNRQHSEYEENETERETERETEGKKYNRESKGNGHKSKTSRLCVEELLHKGNVNSININFDRTNRGKEPVAVCPPGFKGPNKKGDCTARWYDGCGYECHKKKCEAYGGSFSDHDFGGNLNYKCVPSMLSEFGDLEEQTVNETITMKNDGKGKMKTHTHSTEFSTINSRLAGIEDSMESYDKDDRFASLEEKLDSLAQRFASDSTPANVRSMQSESGRGSQSTTQPESAAGMMASTEESETEAEEEAAAAEEEKARAEREEAEAEEEKARAEEERARAEREEAAAEEEKARAEGEEAAAEEEKARAEREEAEEPEDTADKEEPEKEEASSNISTNGKCGKQGNKKICPANEYCSPWGWCGTSSGHKNNSQSKYNGSNIKKSEGKFKIINDNEAIVKKGARFNVTPKFGNTITAGIPVVATPNPSGDIVYDGLNLPISKETVYSYCVSIDKINLFSGKPAMDKCGGFQNYSPLTFKF